MAATPSFVDLYLRGGRSLKSIMARLSRAAAEKRAEIENVYFPFSPNLF
jgi:hypothetical protein